MSKATTNIPFMSLRKPLGILSIALVIASVALLMTRGLNLGLDFTGGTSVVVADSNNVVLSEARTVLAENNFADAVVQHYGSSREINSRVAPREGADADKVGLQVVAALPAYLPAAELRKVEFGGWR